MEDVHINHVSIFIPSYIVTYSNQIYTHAKYKQYFSQVQEF